MIPPSKRSARALSAEIVARFTAVTDGTVTRRSMGAAEAVDRCVADTAGTVTETPSGETAAWWMGVAVTAGTLRDSPARAVVDPYRLTSPSATIAAAMDTR